MSDNGLALTDPRLLLEAARVFNVPDSGYRGAAATVAEQALAALKARRKAAPAKIEPEVEQAIVGDCAALRLGGRVDGGYTEALALLSEQIEKKQPNGKADEKRNDINGRLHLLRALAYGQTYDAARTHDKKDPSDAELVKLRHAISDDLAFAFSQNARLKAANRAAWQPTTADQAAEADLAMAYKEGPEIKAVVDGPAQIADDATKAAGAAADQKPAGNRTVSSGTAATAGTVVSGGTVAAAGTAGAAVGTGPVSASS